MKQHLALLGMQVRDRVTGFSGIVTSICFDLYGCVQVVVVPDAGAKNELADGRWFDEKRLEVTGDKPVMEVPTFEVIPGPAAKPAFARSPLG